MRRILVVAIVLAVACKNKDETPKVQVVEDPGILKAAEEVLNGPVEPVSAKDKAATDPTPILGEWNIKHLQSKINGKLGEISEPIMPGSWVFARDGVFKKTGGNELEGAYVFTGGRLVVSAIGPALDYEIKKLTKTELVVVQRIGGVDIENTTMLERKK
jgi:hypothetical protein